MKKEVDFLLIHDWLVWYILARLLMRPHRGTPHRTPAGRIRYDIRRGRNRTSNQETVPAFRRLDGDAMQAIPGKETEKGCTVSRHHESPPLRKSSTISTSFPIRRTVFANEEESRRNAAFAGILPRFQRYTIVTIVYAEPKMFPKKFFGVVKIFTTYCGGVSDAFTSPNRVGNSTLFLFEIWLE